MINISERLTEKLPGITSLFVSFSYNAKIVDVLRSFASTSYNENTHEWELPINSLAVLLDKLCLIDTLDVTLLKTTKSKNFNSGIDLTQFKTTPFEHQIEGIEYGITNPKWLLLDAPGLGKTLQITYIAELLKKKVSLQHCLIVCGINTLKTNWKMEIEKHSNLTCRILGERKTRSGNVVIGGIKDRLEQLKNPIEEFFVITNVETLRDEKVLKELTKGKSNKFDMIVVDEIHKCKSHQSLQGKHLLKLNTAKYQIGATGTLLLNNPLDAYVPLKWIGAEKSTFSNFKYFYCQFGGPFGNELIGYRNIPLLQYQIQEYSLRRTKDILKLPPKNIITEYVEMNDSQEKFYEEVKTGIIQQVDKVKLNASNVLALVTRLRQATACPSILTTSDIVSSKVDRAVDIAEQLVSQDEKVVIFSTFKETVDVLRKRLEEFNPVLITGNETDQQLEESKYKFLNDPSTRILIGTWQKAGTGLTLTSACYMIFIDTPWTSADFEQACDRIHRIGTNRSVFIYNLVTRNTIDERVLELLQDKGALSEYIVDQKVTVQGLQSLQKYIEELS